MDLENYFKENMALLLPLIILSTVLTFFILFLLYRLLKKKKQKNLFTGNYSRNTTRLGSSRDGGRLVVDNGLELDNPSYYEECADHAIPAHRVVRESTLLCHDIAMGGVPSADGVVAVSRAPEVRRLSSFSECQVSPSRHERRSGRRKSRKSSCQTHNRSRSVEEFERNAARCATECRRGPGGHANKGQLGNYLSFEAGRRSGSYPLCLAEGVSLPKVPLPGCSHSPAAAAVIGEEQHQDSNFIVLQTTNAAGFSNQKFRLTPVLEEATWVNGSPSNFVRLASTSNSMAVAPTACVTPGLSLERQRGPCDASCTTRSPHYFVQCRCQGNQEIGSYPSSRYSHFIRSPSGRGVDMMAFRRYSTPLPPGFKSQQGPISRQSSLTSNQSAKTYYTNHNDIAGSISSISLASSSQDAAHVNGSWQKRPGNSAIGKPVTRLYRHHLASSDSELDTCAAPPVQRSNSFKRAVKSDPVRVWEKHTQQPGATKTCEKSQNKEQGARSVDRLEVRADNEAGPSRDNNSRTAQIGTVAGNHDSLSIDV